MYIIFINYFVNAKVIGRKRQECPLNLLFCIISHS